VKRRGRRKIRFFFKSTDTTFKEINNRKLVKRNLHRSFFHSCLSFNYKIKKKEEKFKLKQKLTAALKKASTFEEEKKNENKNVLFAKCLSIDIFK